MISVVIPTLNAEQALGPCLAALVPAAVDGVVREVIIADGGSTDATGRIADETGANFISAARGRGGQLSAGGEAAKSDWILFLHADTALQAGWHEEAAKWIVRAEAEKQGLAAAAFRFTLDDHGARARILEMIVGLRCRFLSLPYGDQGLLISRRLYDRLGGFSEIPLMEDVELVRRVGRKQLTLLRSQAVTSAARYRRDGYFARSLRNLFCLTLYYLRVPPHRIQRFYG